ncbi:MAG: hypothetical protein KF788_03665 [Piscinibacter sp.]|nr:hypothetical protein [Piscinibacter sp.]
MGQDVDRARFAHQDFDRFTRCLREELGLLHALDERGALSAHAPMAGLELEAWLIDAQGRPAPRNAEFIERIARPEVVTELGRFNIELNVPPQPVAGDGLARLAQDLEVTWSRCREVAASLGLQVVATGILPSLRDADLTLANLSDRTRYRALNRQVLRQRQGRPIRLDIDGPGGDRLHCEHRDVMLESAATSFQVHLQVPAAQMLRHYNAAIVASAPLLALAANSPLLFGHVLWAETRIPLFEQALGVATRVDGVHPALSRVGFGSGYAGYSLLEVFRENVERFEPMLPLALGEAPARLAHLRLHNGTIWRWNRPVLGFDEDGTPHLRLEHRPLPAGPTLPDMMAHLACTIGLVHALASEAVPPESRLGFDTAARNFQAAARHGLDARLRWTDGREHAATPLLRRLLRQAGDGLADLGAPAARTWLGLLDARLRRGLGGEGWLRERLAARGGELAAVTLDIAALQASGAPLHAWR